MDVVVNSNLGIKLHKELPFPVESNSPDILVLLEAGEPPITTEEVMSWRNQAASLCRSWKQCFVEVSRSSCCLFKAREALSDILILRHDLSGNDGSETYSKGLVEDLQEEIGCAIRERSGTCEDGLLHMVDTGVDDVSLNAKKI